MSEEWRPVPGFSGYEVSNAGQVRSWRRPGPLGGVRDEPLVMSPILNGRGYFHATLSQRKFLIHRLVLLAFVGEPPDGNEVRHLDGNPLNNHLSNLAYGTRSENNYDAVRHGTHGQARKTHCKRGHPLSGQNLRITSRGTRRCRECARLREAERAPRKRVRTAA